VAYEQGRRPGWRWGRLAMSVVAFISLLGLEKAILAGCWGLLAVRGSAVGGRA